MTVTGKDKGSAVTSFEDRVVIDSEETPGLEFVLRLGERLGFEDVTAMVGGVGRLVSEVEMDTCLVANVKFGVCVVTEASAPLEIGLAASVVVVREPSTVEDVITFIEELEELLIALVVAEGKFDTLE